MLTYSPLNTLAISAVRKYTRRPSFSLAILMALAQSESERKLMRSPSAERSSILANWAMLNSGPYCFVSASSMCITHPYALITYANDPKEATKVGGCVLEFC